MNRNFGSFTISAEQAEIEKWRQIKSDQDAKALSCMKALEWLESHGCIFTPQFSWDGSTPLLQAALRRMDDDNYRYGSLG